MRQTNTRTVLRPTGAFVAAALFACTAFTLPALANPAVAAPAWQVDFDAPDGSARAWMKRNGFKEQRGSAKKWRIAGGALVTSQDENSTTVGTQKGFPRVTESAPILKLRFKVAEWPRKGNLARKSTEDAALRVFVIFDHGGGLLSPPDTLGYAFASSQPVGAVVTSQRFDNVKFIPVANGAGYTGGWVEVERDVAADYREAFGRKAPKIKAIGIKSDANNTDGKASAHIDWIQLHPR